MSNIHEKYFELDATNYIRLKPEYRGATESASNTGIANGRSDNGKDFVGSLHEQLPECLVMPETVNGVTVNGIADCAFYNNKRIKSIVLPDTFTAIPNYCFTKCTQLEAISGCDSITSIGTTAFAKCQLKAVVFDNVTSCGTKAFYCCGALESASFAKLTSINEQMFNYCDSLKALNMPVCVEVKKRGLAVTSDLTRENTTFGTITKVGVDAFNVSGYQFTLDELDKITFSGNINVNLYKNKPFVTTWRNVCANLLNKDIVVKLPVYHSYEQDDSVWSNAGPIEWLNWGTYDEVTHKYNEYLPDFSYENYWDANYAGSYTDAVEKTNNTVTGMGCTLHAMTGAYLGLFKPFGDDTVIDNPKLFQELVIRKTGGRDSEGIPYIVQEWADSELQWMPSGTKGLTTHKWGPEYKQNRRKLIRYSSGGKYYVTANTTYLTTFIANKLGLEVELVGYNYDDYHYTSDEPATEDPVAVYLKDEANWDKYLSYIITSLQSGNYVELICCYGSSQQHAVLIYGVDKDGYVYINNTAFMDYEFSDSCRGGCFKVPLENVLTFYYTSAHTASSITESAILGSQPLIVFSKKDTALSNFSNSFIENCEYMLQDKEAVTSYFGHTENLLELGEAFDDELTLDTDRVDWTILQELIDVVNNTNAEERYVTDSDLEARLALSKLI